MAPGGTFQGHTEMMPVNRLIGHRRLVADPQDA